MRRITIIALSGALAMAAFTVSAAPASAAVVGQACSGGFGGTCGPLYDDVLNVCRPIGQPRIADSAWNSSNNRTIRLYANLLGCQNNNPLVTLNPGASSSAFSAATFYRVT